MKHKLMRMAKPVRMKRQTLQKRQLKGKVIADNINIQTRFFLSIFVFHIPFRTVVLAVFSMQEPSSFYNDLNSHEFLIGSTHL